MKKILICYFSASGATKSVALKLSKLLNTNLFEIVPETLYSKEDLDWTNENSRSSKEMKNELSRPKTKEKVSNIDDYDTIVLGFPVWWYKEPNIINTFIEENNLDGKDVYVFVTSGSTSVDGSLNSLKQKYPSINFVEGKRLSVNDDFKDWSDIFEKMW